MRRMAISREKQDKIIQALDGRLKGSLTCPLCGAQKWTIADGFVLVALEDDGSVAFHLGGPRLPSAAIICDNCGNTHLINLIKLNLGNLLDK
jgi:transcription elongation factor Elf1